MQAGFSLITRSPRSLLFDPSIFLGLLMIELVLNRISGDAGFEFGSQMPSFSFTPLVLFRVGRPQKPGGLAVQSKRDEPVSETHAEFH